MSDQTSGDAPSGASNAPFESALNATLRKLNDQLLLFLLGYMILVIGLVVFGSQLVPQLQLLLYVVPVLGACGYLIARRRTIR